MLVYLKKIPMTFPLTSIPTKINFPLYSIIMWLKQCHKPPMTGNGNHTTYKHGEIWDGLSLFCQHYYILLPSECTFMLGTFIMVAQYYLLISHVGKNIYTYIWHLSPWDFLPRHIEEIGGASHGGTKAAEEKGSTQVVRLDSKVRGNEEKPWGFLYYRAILYLLVITSDHIHHHQTHLFLWRFLWK